MWYSNVWPLEPIGPPFGFWARRPTSSFFSIRAASELNGRCANVCLRSKLRFVVTSAGVGRRNADLPAVDSVRFNLRLLFPSKIGCVVDWYSIGHCRSWTRGVCYFLVVGPCC